MANEKAWEAESENWKSSLFYSSDSGLMKWLLKIGKKTDKILDQGCGIGQYAFSAYKQGFQNVIGMDLSQKLIETARSISKELNYEIEFIQGDIRKMPFENTQFNIVLSGGIVEHVPETEKAVFELARILKPGGYLLIHVPQRYSTFTLLKNIQRLLGLWKLGYEKSFSKNSFSKLLQKHGFEIQEYFLNEFTPGKHAFIGNLIKLIDKPLYLLGLGGYHMAFLCKKSNTFSSFN
jgi:ubiquinone/menaquinone biosynthesis C-methylase UbiE